jgi:hypothetical protein
MSDIRAATGDADNQIFPRPARRSLAAAVPHLTDDHLVWAKLDQVYSQHANMMLGKILAPLDAELENVAHQAKQPGRGATLNQPARIAGFDEGDGFACAPAISARPAHSLMFHAPFKPFWHAVFRAKNHKHSIFKDFVFPNRR